MTTAAPRADGPHGYGAYTHGCRCPICRQAKADYMRQRRQDGRLASLAANRYIADTPSHGTRYAYEELGCRCQPCTTARTASDMRKPSRRWIQRAA